MRKACKKAPSRWQISISASLITSLTCKTTCYLPATVLHLPSTRWVAHRLSEQKQRLQLLSPDDLLQNVEQALSLCAGASLATTLAAQYPVAMVDEFQDTDPVQFAIFQQVYLNQVEQATTLVMIGDPKQAIYRFRGGDIYTYLQAKHQIPATRQFTLSTNYRSQTGLVAAFNHLFMPANAAFAFGDDIPYIAVSANKRIQGLHSANPNSPLPGALNLHFLPSKDNKCPLWRSAAAQKPAMPPAKLPR